MLVTLAITAVLAAGCPHATQHSTPAREARAVLCLVNAARVSHGLGRLRVSPPLGVAARGWARTLVRTRHFSHTGAGSTPGTRIAHAGYHARGYGETIAWGQGALGTPAGTVDQWLNSPPHRAVLLSPQMRDAGVGVVRGAPVAGAHGGTTVVADLGYR